MADFSDLVGMTITHIDGGEGSDELVFTMSDGSRYMLLHYQDCCESVYLEDVAGDFEDLLNSPILHAEESCSKEPPEGHTPCGDSETWTFYRITTIKGSVVLRWYGSSNGYYSERVSFNRAYP